MSEILRTTGEGLGILLESLKREVISEIDWHRVDLSGANLDNLSF